MLDAFVRETVSTTVSLLSTDEWRRHGPLGRDYPHGVVRHSQDEYVHGAIHTHTIEGFWSIVKRGIMGTFHRLPDPRFGCNGSRSRADRSIVTPPPAADEPS